MQTTKQKVFSPFGIFLSFFIISLTVLTMAGLIKVYNILNAYENSQPNICLNRVISLFKDEDWEQLGTMAGVKLSKFEEYDEIGKNLGNFDIEKLTYKKQKGMNFLITNGKKKFADVTLKENKEIVQYGFFPLEIEKISLNLNYWGKTKIEAPQNSKISFNGISIPSDVINKKVIMDSKWGISQESSYILKKLYYETEVFLNEPKIEGTLNEIPLLMQQQGRVIVFYKKVDSNEQKSISEFSQEVAMSYAKFISNDLKFDDIKNYFLIGTDTYKNLQSFYNGWYIEHDGFLFENIKISSVKALSNKHFCCRVKFNYVVTRPWHRYEYPSDYQIFMVKTNGGLKVSSLTIN